MNGILYFDGTFDAAHNRAGWGTCIRLPGSDDHPTDEVGVVHHDPLSCNVAEYVALREGLTRARRLGVLNIEIYGDSMLVVRQIQGAWRVKSRHLARLNAEVLSILAHFESWSIDWVGRGDNPAGELFGGSGKSDDVVLRA